MAARVVIFIVAVSRAMALDITVEGNAAVGADEIRAAALASGSLDLEAVKRLYLMKGFLNAEVSAIEEGGGYKILISEGVPYRLGLFAIENESSLGHDEIKDFLPYRPGDVLALPALREGLVALLETLAAKGYLRAEAEYEVVASAPGRADVRVRIREGKRFVVGEVSFSGARPGDEEMLRSRLETRRGRPLRGNVLARDLIAVIDFYRERGFAQATARPSDFRIYEPAGEVDFRVAVDRRTAVTVGAIGITGNRRTRDAVVRRQLTFAPGDPYNIEEIRKSSRRVYNLKYFEAEPEIKLVDAVTGGMAVAVRERRTYRASGALAYEPATAAYEKSGFVGEMEVNLANVAGTGRECGGKYRRLAAGDMDAAGRYYEPWIGGRDLFAEPEGNYRERTRYRRFVGELSLGTHPALDLTVAAGAGWERVWEEDASRKIKVFTWATYDGRDDFFNPRRGWEVHGRAELGVKSYFTDGFAEQVPKFETDAWRFFTVARDHVMAFRGGAKAFFARRVTADELFPLGGRADLRGFKEEQFLTDRQALLTAEYRFLVTARGRLYLFTDAAYRHLLQRETFDEGVALGYGAGFTVATDAGTYGVAYGLAAGEGPLEGKIHVSVTEEF